MLEVVESAIANTPESMVRWSRLAMSANACAVVARAAAVRRELSIGEQAHKSTQLNSSESPGSKARRIEVKRGATLP